MSSERMQTLLEGMRELAAKAQSFPINNETLAAGMALAEQFQEFDLLIAESGNLPSDWK